ncbi:MAG: hypothetical protein ACKO2Z_01765, partial [Sphaerospermopsis kisseleviana]
QMTTTLCFKIRVMKNQITACLREISKGVKSFVDKLIILEGQLERLLKESMYKNSKSEAISKMSGEHIADIDQLEIERVEPANPFFPAIESYVTPNGQKVICADVLRESAKYTNNYRSPIVIRTQEQLIQDYIGFDIR